MLCVLQDESPPHFSHPKEDILYVWLQFLAEDDSHHNDGSLL